MRVLGATICCLSLLAITTCCFALQKRSLEFAPLPIASEPVLQNGFSPFVRYLEKATHLPVNLKITSSYHQLREGLLNNEIDLAMLAPLPYVEISALKAEIVPVVAFVNQQGNADSICCLATYSGDHIEIGTDRPLFVSLIQPYATCGYLMSESLLRQHDYSLKNGSYIYSGSPRESALDVLRGTTQIAGIPKTMAKEYQHLGLKIITESNPVPGYLLIANSRTVSGQTIAAIRDELLKLNPLHCPNDNQLTQKWDQSIRYGSIAIEPADYVRIRDLFETMTIPGITP